MTLIPFCKSQRIATCAAVLPCLPGDVVQEPLVSDFPFRQGTVRGDMNAVFRAMTQQPLSVTVNVVFHLVRADGHLRNVSRFIYLIAIKVADTDTFGFARIENFFEGAESFSRMAQSDGLVMWMSKRST